MSVQVHGVSSAGFILNDNAYAVVVAEVVDVPLLIRGGLVRRQDRETRSRGSLRDQRGRKCCPYLREGG